MIDKDEIRKALKDINSGGWGYCPGRDKLIAWIRALLEENDQLQEELERQKRRADLHMIEYAVEIVKNSEACKSMQSAVYALQNGSTGDAYESLTGWLDSNRTDEPDHPPAGWNDELDGKGGGEG